MEEGWYLMSTPELERVLARVRDPDEPPETSTPSRLTIEEALAYRNAGNLPDDLGRTLRLVLYVADDPEELSRKRLIYEPDHHEAPSWRREGSRPVNVVPIRTTAPRSGAAGDAWWDDPDVARLEEEWSARGTVAGIPVPGEYRGFVLKTVIALRRADREVTADSIADSISRWLPPAEAESIRAALKRAGAGPGPG